MGDYDGDHGDGGGSGRPGRRWGVAALVLVTLLVGGVAGYLVRDRSADPVQVTVAPPVPDEPAAGAPPPDTPSPCVEVAQGGTELIAALERGVRAIGDLDPGALRGVLDEIERLRDALRADVGACDAQLGGGTAGPPDGPGPTGPEPTGPG